MYIQDQDVVSKFDIPEAGAINKTNNEARLERDFKPLVEILMKKYKDDAKKVVNTPFLPATMKEVEKEYTLIFPENTQSKKWRFTEPSSVSDIQVVIPEKVLTTGLLKFSHFLG